MVIMENEIPLYHAKLATNSRTIRVNWLFQNLERGRKGSSRRANVVPNLDIPPLSLLWPRGRKKKKETGRVPCFHLASTKLPLIVLLYKKGLTITVNTVNNDALISQASINPSPFSRPITTPSTRLLFFTLLATHNLTDPRLLIRKGGVVTAFPATMGPTGPWLNRHDVPPSTLLRDNIIILRAARGHRSTGVEEKGERH